MKSFDFCSLEDNGNRNSVDPNLLQKAKKVLKAQGKASKERKERTKDAEFQKEQADENVIRLQQARRRSHVRGSYRGLANTQDNGFGFPVDARPARLPAPRFTKQKRPQQQSLNSVLFEEEPETVGDLTGGMTSRSHDTTTSQHSMMESINNIHAPSPKPRSPKVKPGSPKHDQFNPASHSLLPLSKEEEEAAANLRDLSTIMDLTRRSLDPIVASQDSLSTEPRVPQRRRRAPRKKREYYSVLPSLSRGGVAARQKFREADNVRNEIEIKRQQAVEKKHRMVFRGNEHSEHQLHSKSSKVAVAEELVVLKSIMIREQMLLTLVTLLKQLELDYHRYQHYKRKKVKHHQNVKHRGHNWMKKEEHIDTRSRQIAVEVHLRQKEMKALLAQLRAASLETVEAVQAWREVHNKEIRKRFFGKSSTGNQPKPPTRTFRWQGQNYLIKMQHDIDHLDHFSVIEAWVGFPLSSNPLLIPPEPFEWIEELAKMKEELGERLKAKRAMKAQSRAEQIRANMGGGTLALPPKRKLSKQATMSGRLDTNSEGQNANHSPRKSPRKRNSLERALMLGGVDGFEAVFSTPRTGRSDRRGTHQSNSTARSKTSNPMDTSRNNSTSRPNSKSKEGSDDDKDSDATEESEMSSGIEEVICFPDLVPEDQMVLAFPEALRARVKTVEQILKNELNMENQEQKERMEKIRRQHMSQQLLHTYSAQELRNVLKLKNQEEDDFKEALRQLQEDTSLVGSRSSLASSNSAVFMTELKKEIALHNINSPSTPKHKPVKFNQSKLKARMEVEKEASRKLKLMSNRRSGVRRIPRGIKGTFVVPANTKFKKDPNHQVQVTAVIKVQSTLRGHLGRIRVAKERASQQALRRDFAAKKIQSSFRGMGGRREARSRRIERDSKALREKNLEQRTFRAACRIQVFFKNVVAEAKEYRHKEYLESNAKIIHDGARKIQRLYRLLLRSRARHRRMVHQQRVAARKIQRLVRQHLQRKLEYNPDYTLNLNPDSEEEEPDPSAVMARIEPSFIKLQAWVRMRSVQKKYRYQRLRWLEENRRRQEDVLKAAHLAVQAAQKAADEYEAVQTKLPPIDARFVAKEDHFDDSKGSGSFKVPHKNKNTQKMRKISTFPSLDNAEMKKKKQPIGRSTRKKAPVQINIVDLL